MVWLCRNQPRKATPSSTETARSVLEIAVLLVSACAWEVSSLSLGTSDFYRSLKPAFHKRNRKPKKRKPPQPPSLKVACFPLYELLRARSVPFQLPATPDALDKHFTYNPTAWSICNALPGGSTNWNGTMAPGRNFSLHSHLFSLAHWEIKEGILIILILIYFMMSSIKYPISDIPSRPSKVRPKDTGAPPPRWPRSWGQRSQPCEPALPESIDRRHHPRPAAEKMVSPCPSVYMFSKHS